MDIKNFLNDKGQIKIWPSKHEKKKEVVAYLSTKFTKDITYKEKEINEIIEQFHTFSNTVLLRRSLVDYGYLARTKDGSAYWVKTEEDLLLLGKRILTSKSKIVFKYDNTSNFEDYFVVKAGTWEYLDGYIIGTETGNKGGIIYTKDSFDFDILLSFDVATIKPATRDLNAVWCSSWDDKTNYLANSYVCGINGWYDGKSGIEKCGEENLNATTTLYDYTPGEEINIKCGSIKGHCFMFVNNKLVLEMFDNNPLTTGYVGFSPYCTKLKIRNVVIRKIEFEDRSQSYTPEF